MPTGKLPKDCQPEDILKWLAYGLEGLTAMIVEWREKFGLIPSEQWSQIKLHVIKINGILYHGKPPVQLPPSCNKGDF